MTRLRLVFVGKLRFISSFYQGLFFCIVLLSGFQISAVVSGLSNVVFTKCVCRDGVGVLLAHTHSVAISSQEITSSSLLSNSIFDDGERSSRRWARLCLCFNFLLEVVFLVG